MGPAGGSPSPISDQPDQPDRAVPPAGGPARRAPLRDRALALLSLVLATLFAVGVVVFLTRNIEYVLVGLAGLALAAGGGWWLITERAPRQAVGLVGVLAGMAIIAVAAVKAAPDSNVVIRLAILCALPVATVASARAALLGAIRDHDDRRPQHVSPPAKPVLICNPWSGGGKVAEFDLVGLAEKLGVEVVMLDHGLDLERLARSAVRHGADCLGMAGGDGSQALVASIAVEHDLPFVCVTAGTRNHFALDLGLDRDDPRKSLCAFADAVERRVDYATIGDRSGLQDRFFVNNVSLGVYATIVQQEGYRNAKVQTTKGVLADMLGRTDEPFDLQFTEPGGAEVDGAFLIQVSNNPYALGASIDATQRRRLDTGTLGVVAITAASGREAAKVITLSAIGQRRRSRSWHEFTTPTFEVRSRSGKAFVGIDGEALELATPLEFAIHERGLRLLVPEGNLTAAERRQARDVSVRELLAIARGGDPLTATG